ncbi:MAG: hypothetical protein KGO83_07235 [Paenibacillaceae bacterium]|nr:hypothetical protein [Paenibacillaceae bacterium]
MRHCSVQVRGLLTRDERDRYEALMDIGQWLELQREYDRASVIQREVDRLVAPAIERLKEKGRARDAQTIAYVQEKSEGERTQ